MNRLAKLLQTRGAKSAFRALLICLWLIPGTLFASKPNIILILADDMGPGEPAHMGGLVATPALDKMAGEGMRFTDAHFPQLSETGAKAQE